MSNYFEQIEQNFSKIRGQHSRLNPIDWQLCEEWEKRVPLHIVLNAMDEVAKKFGETKRPDKINSLSYFKQAVEKSATEYAAAQIGKTPEENMEIGIDPAAPNGNETLVHTYDKLLKLADQYTDRNDLPESVRIAAEAVAADLRELHKSNKTISDIEEKLREMQNSLMYPLALELSDEDRIAIIDEINHQYGHRNLDDYSRAKIANRKLHKKYELPELTLFEF